MLQTAKKTMHASVRLASGRQTHTTGAAAGCHWSVRQHFCIAEPSLSVMFTAESPVHYVERSYVCYAYVVAYVVQIYGSYLC